MAAQCHGEESNMRKGRCGGGKRGGRGGEGRRHREDTTIPQQGSGDDIRVAA